MPNTVAQMYDVISVCLVSSDQPLHSVSHLLLWGVKREQPNVTFNFRFSGKCVIRTRKRITGFI